MLHGLYTTALIQKISCTGLVKWQIDLFALFNNWIDPGWGGPDGIIAQLNWNVINFKSEGAWL